ncbi:MAG: RICIN domain-containing protein [Gemmatimonas sp.]
MKTRMKLITILAMALSATTATTASAQSHLVNFGSGLCLEPVAQNGNYWLNGLPIMQNTCRSGDSSQRWSLEFVKVVSGFNYYHIVNLASGMCLDDRDGNTADRAPVQQWTCNNTSTTMQWTQGRNVNSYVVLYNLRSSKCLDVPGGWSTPGLQLQLYRCTNTASVINTAQLFGWFGS